jgi:hypothetical protein
VELPSRFRSAIPLLPFADSSLRISSGSARYAGSKSPSSTLPKLQFPLTKSYRSAYDFFMQIYLSFFGNETLTTRGNDSAFCVPRRRSTSATNNSVARK